MARTWQAAIARARQPEQQRRDATLCIDEAHNSLNLPGSVEDMPAEAPGFRLGLVLAHLNVYTAAARLLVANREMPAFTFTTNPPVAARGDLAAIRARHEQVHARPSGESPMQHVARRHCAAATRPEVRRRSGRRPGRRTGRRLPG